MTNSISNQPVFPHIKLTDETFPRALATRILKEDSSEYFGAFLNRTNVRILIGFLNKTFRLRSCTIEIDGGFEVPCTQYYSKRCVAPCVASLCNRETYDEMVDLARLFLRNDRDLLHAELNRRITVAADELDFETAAYFRDILQSVERFWSEPRWQVWPDDTVDTFELYADDEAAYVIVISQRGRRTLGEAVFALAALDDPTRLLRDVLLHFYRFHLPRGIRLSHDFDERPSVVEKLEQRFGRKVNVTVASDVNRRITAERAVAMTKARLDLERAKHRPTTKQLIKRLQDEFVLSRTPHRIEAFDVAHISATGFAAAVSVWENGEDLPDAYETWLSDRSSELDTLRSFGKDRVSRTSPDLVLIDGGPSQFRAAMESLSDLPVSPGVISAVKPKSKHASISHFLTPVGRIEFRPDDEVHRLLHRLRDDAHELANATHRLSRDMMHFYELAAIVPPLNERERQELLRELGSLKAVAALGAEYLEARFGRKRGKQVARDIERFRNGLSPERRPLIVPIRFVETDGAAEDLIPIDIR